VTDEPRRRCRGGSADVVCPFAYVGIRRLIAARDNADADVALRVHPWPLEWVNGVAVTAAEAAEDVEALRTALAPDLFLGFDPTTFPTSSIPAFGLVEVAYASSERLGEVISVTVREAVFEHGRDISQKPVLDEIAARFGIVPPDAVAAEAAVRDEWRLGRERGVVGSPHFFVDERSIFCPSLDIERADEHLVVHLAEDSMRDFLDLALG
jgi:predicted DsbA family dithiol-disulfide isomerase